MREVSNMKALVIYESIFGNTREIAEMIAEGLSGSFDEVELAEVNDGDSSMNGIDLLVLGGPTHVWSMSRQVTRDDARTKAEDKGITPVSQGSKGIREFVYDLPHDDGDTLAATFDTRVQKGWIPSGSAAGSAAKRLKKKGYQLFAQPQQFEVLDTGGPLQSGELERATEWGKTLGEQALETISREPVAAGS